MGLKGYRLWVMGQPDSNVQSPTAALMLSTATRTASASWNVFTSVPRVDVGVEPSMRGGFQSFTLSPPFSLDLRLN
jgi:hypothetical protein